MTNKIIKIYNSIIFITVFLSTSVSFSVELPSEELVKSKLKNKSAEKVTELSSKSSNFISNFAQDNLNSLKYLDFDLQVREHLKPTVSLMSVSEILKIDSGTVFNQTSLNTHDSDETINIGFGLRKLLNNDKLIVGSNIFYDQQFNENHKRTGAGLEAISSVFDLRGNYYNALSGQKSVDGGGSERALDGKDIQLDYHFPSKYDLNFFVSAFKFKNPDKSSDYEEKGNKFGTNAMLGNWSFEAGYLDDNQENDSYFGSIKYVVSLGNKIKKDYYAMSELEKPITDAKIKNTFRKGRYSSNRGFLEEVSVADKLYMPVKRENKIRVVKISAAGVVASGF